MPTTEKTQQIIHAFNTKNTSEIANYSTEELKEAIVDLDWRNKGDQKAIQTEIDEREKTSNRKYQSNIRAVGYIVALGIALSIPAVIWAIMDF